MRHRLRSAHGLRGLVVASALVSAACSDDTMGPAPAGGDVRVNLFAKTAGVSTSIAVARGTARAVPSVEIQRVAVVLGTVKLETAGVDPTVDWILERSRVVELNLAGAPTAAAEYDVTPGTYKEIEVSIDKLEEGNPSEEPLIATYPALRNASVVAEGTVTRDDGSTAPFVWATDLDRDLEIALQPFLVIEPASAGESVAPTVVAVVIRVGDWFDDGAGGLLDPTDEADRSDIESNVADSVLAFADPDEDGVDDD